MRGVVVRCKWLALNFNAIGYATGYPIGYTYMTLPRAYTRGS